MGFFPILMNVIQFWLIDSIVKAGGIAGIALPSSDSLDPADREPLFHSPTDPANDDDDDSEDGAVVISPPKCDVEAQGQAQLLRRSNDSTHTYPPSLTSSPPGAPTVHRTSMSPPPVSRNVLSTWSRNSPPILLPSRPPKLPTLNSAGQSLETGRDVSTRSKEDWQAWDGDEDWVDRVGEEHQAGQPAKARKGEADSV
jgi:hypothetical protein